MNYAVVRLFHALPVPLKKLALLFGGKERGEYLFQKGWAKEFAANKDKVLEYWNKYRYFSEIHRICELDSKKRILDVGCGISTVLHFLPGERYGIDPLADKYKRLYSYPPELHIQSSAGEQLPFPDRHFDLVFCTNVLDHTSDPRVVLNEIARVLKADGKLVLTVEVFESEEARDPAHPHCFTEEIAKSLVSEHFEALFVKESPWISLRAYVNGISDAHGVELIMILKKRVSGH